MFEAYTCYHVERTPTDNGVRTSKCDYQTIDLAEAKKHVAENPEHEVRDIHGRVVTSDGE